MVKMLRIKENIDVRSAPVKLEELESFQMVQILGI